MSCFYAVARGVKSSNTSQIKILALIPLQFYQPIPSLQCLMLDYLVYVEPKNILELALPASLQGVTQHHVDFIRCDNIDTANTVKELMQQQWSELVKPGCRVKVKIMDKFVDAVVERTHFISKLSFDCCYFFATAKAEVKVSGSDSTRLYQFRDLSFL